MLLPLLLPQQGSRVAGQQGSRAAGLRRKAPRIVVIRESMYSARVSFSVSSAVISPCVSMILALVSVGQACRLRGERRAGQGSVHHQLPPIVRCSTSTWAMSAARSSLDDALAEAVIVRATQPSAKFAEFIKVKRAFTLSPSSNREYNRAHNQAVNGI